MLHKDFQPWEKCNTQLVDMKFLLSCSTWHLTCLLHSLMSIRVKHLKRNSTSMPAHLLFSIYYMELRPDLFVFYLLLMEKKNTKVMTVSMEMSVWETPNQVRTNQSSWIYHMMTLPYYKKFFWHWTCDNVMYCTILPQEPLILVSCSLLTIFSLGILR